MTSSTILWASLMLPIHRVPAESAWAWRPTATVAAALSCPSHPAASDFDAKITEAESAWRAGDWASARVRLLEAERISGDSFHDYRFHLAYVLLRLGERDAGLRQLEEFSTLERAKGNAEWRSSEFVAPAALEETGSDRLCYDELKRRLDALDPAASKAPAADSPKSASPAKAGGERPAVDAGEAARARGTPLGDALSELWRQEGLQRGVSEADAEALRSLRECIDSAAKGEKLRAIDRRQIERLAEAAEKAEPCTEEGRRAVEEFFAATRTLMCKHPDELEFIARRAALALRWQRADDAWESGRVLAAMGGENAEGQEKVLDSMLEIENAGLAVWSRGEARSTVLEIARDALAEAKEVAGRIADEKERTEQVESLSRIDLDVRPTPAAEAATPPDAEAATPPDAEAATPPDAEAEKARRASLLQAVKDAQAKVAEERGISRMFRLRDLAKAEAAAGDIAGAKRTVESLKDTSYRARAFRAIAEEQAKAGDREGSRATFAQALDEALRIDEDVADKLSHFCDIAEVEHEIGAAAAARATLEGVAKSVGSLEGWKSIWVHERLGRAYAKIGEAALSNAAFERAIEAAVRDGDDHRLARTLESMLDAGERESARRHVGALLEIAQSRKDPDGRAWSLEDAAEIQIRAGDLDGARQTLARLVEAAMDPACEHREAHLRDAAALHARAGDFDSAKDCVARMGDGTRWAAWYLIARSGAEAGHLDEALTSMQEGDRLSAAVDVDDSGYVRIQALLAMGKARAKTGDRRAAVSSFSEASRIAVLISRHKSELCAEVARAQLEAGDLEGPLDLVGFAYRYQWIGFIRDIVVARVAAGDRTGARSLVEVMKRGTKEWPPDEDRVRLHAWLAEAYATLGERDAAKASVDAAISDFRQSESSFRFVLTITHEGNCIARSLGKLGRRGDASVFLNDLKPKVDRFTGERTLSGRVEKLADIAVAQFAAGYGADAKRTLELAVESYRRQRPPSASVANDLVKDMVAMGDLEQAAGIAREIGDVQYRAWSIREITYARARSGDIGGALREARCETDPLVVSEGMHAAVRGIRDWLVAGV